MIDTVREKLAKVPDQDGVRRIVNALVGRVVRSAHGLSCKVNGEFLEIPAEWWIKGYRQLWRLVLALLAGETVADVKGAVFTTHLMTLEGALKDALALIEKAPEVKYPRGDRVLTFHNDNTEINGVQVPLEVWWMVPIPPGEHDTNLADASGSLPRSA